MADQRFSTRELVGICSVTPRQVQWWCEHGLLLEHWGSGHWREFTRDDALLVMIVSELRQKTFGELQQHAHLDLRRVRAAFLHRSGQFLLADGKRFTWQATEAAVIEALKKHPGGMHVVDVAVLEVRLAQEIEKLRARVAPARLPRPGKVLSAGGRQ